MNVNTVIELADQFFKLAAKKPTHKEQLPPPNWLQRSSLDEAERDLLKHKIVPISTGGGSLSSYISSGLYSSVYEVMYKGKRMVAKVTQETHDAEQYRRVMELRKEVPSEVKKHLPNIYDIIELGDDNYFGGFAILSEMLQPLNPHVRDLLKSELGKKKMPSIDSIKKVIDRRMPRVLEYITSGSYMLNKVKQDIDAFFNTKKDFVYDNVVNYVLGTINKDPKINQYINLIANELKNVFMARKFKKHEWDKKDIDRTSKTMAENLCKNMYGSVSVFLKEFPRNYDSMVHEPESITFFESLPETKSLLNALIYLNNEKGFRWSDLHLNNLMERPSTGDIVISDVGNFGK